MSNINSRKYFITGGGTGGHIYPAMAVADVLAELGDDVEIFYVGNPNNLEYSIVQQKGYKFLPIYIKGMPRKIGFRFIWWAFKLGIAVMQSLFYLYKYKPKAIFGTGGYVSAPIMIASILEGKTPFMMHDCDAQPGLVTRKLAPYASAVSLAFDKAQDFIKNKNCHVNGNPLRPRFKTLNKGLARAGLTLDYKRPVLLVMGGSQGAKSIDDAFVEIIKELSTVNNLQIIFQTGKKNYQSVMERLEKIYPNNHRDKNLIIRPYFDDMVTVLKAADIVISRAGSLSLSEIFASDVAPVLIPYPHAASDHQRRNAKFVEEKGACVYLEDSETNPNTLLAIVNNLLEDEELQTRLRTNASKLAQFDALQHIVQQFVEVAK